MNPFCTRIGVILAGGSGERFWPLSRMQRPKQLLRLANPHASMLEQSVELLKRVLDGGPVYVVTGKPLMEAMRKASLGIPAEHIIAEPCKRNTSGALAYAAAYVMAMHDSDGSDLLLAVATADHRIGDPARFQAVAHTAMAAAEEQDALVVLGVVPDRPETGYGYIQAMGEPLVISGGETKVPAYAVHAYHEKPDRSTAEAFLADGFYYWNSGMFFWRVGTFLHELRMVRPSLAKAVEDLAQALRAGEQTRACAIFEALEDISIDYALLEHAQRVIMVRADFPWDDVGAWPALERTFDGDSQGNILCGEPVAIDCSNCIIYNEPGPEQMAVSVIGMSDIIVVATGDAVLVLPKDRAQDVRAAVQELKHRGAPQV